MKKKWRSRKGWRLLLFTCFALLSLLSSPHQADGVIDRDWCMEFFRKEGRMVSKIEIEGLFTIVYRGVLLLVIKALLAIVAVAMAVSCLLLLLLLFLRGQ